MENWVQITDFPRYSVSDEGRVRNDATDRVMSCNVNQSGVMFVGLVGPDGKQATRSVARLVAEAFVETDNEFHDTPIYLDGDRTNLSPDNIVYRPRWYATKYSQQFRKRYHTPIITPMVNMDTGETYTDSWDCCTKNGLLEEQLVIATFNRERVPHTGQLFGFPEDYVT